MSFSDIVSGIKQGAAHVFSSSTVDIKSMLPIEKFPAIVQSALNANGVSGASVAANVSAPVINTATPATPSSHSVG